MLNMDRVYYGAIANPIDPATLALHPNGLLAVTKDGIIAWFEPDVESSLVQDVLAAHAWIDAPLIALASGEWIMPGFIDTHTVSISFP
jgi:guanine deaminase